MPVIGFPDVAVLLGDDFHKRSFLPVVRFQPDRIATDRWFFISDGFTKGHRTLSDHE